MTKQPRTAVINLAGASYPLKDGLILGAFLIAWPALAAIVRCQVILNISGAIGRTGRLDQKQTLFGFRHVDDSARIAVVFATSFFGVLLVIVRGLQTEYHMRIVAHHAGHPIRSTLGENRLDLLMEKVKIPWLLVVQFRKHRLSILSLDESASQFRQTRRWILTMPLKVSR